MSSRAERLSTLIINSTQQDGVQVITVHDRIDLYSANELREYCRIQWDLGDGKLVIDLGNVDYIDSSGVGVLLSLYTHSQKRNLSLAFVNISRDIESVLRLTRLNGFLPIFPTVEEAVSEFKGQAEHQSANYHGLLVDENSPLFEESGMSTGEFNIDLSQIRRLSNLIAQKAPHEIHEINLLEQQISELIKNAVRHGNKNDKNKKIVVSWEFSHHHARLIVEDEGEGFQNLDEWNEFYRERLRCHREGQFEKMMDYLSFRTDESVPDDGGNAMFAAVEYWNQGVVYNDKRNKVAVKRHFY
jgi:serine/threonine-protein kinase RsbW